VPTTWVVLLRGVNVGGHRRVPMAPLRAALEAAGARDVATYLQSGNAVLTVDGDEASVTALARAAVQTLGVECDVVVRTGIELAEVVARNPWPDRSEGAPHLLHVGFLPTPGQVTAARVRPEEEVRGDGREVWVWYGGGAGRSKLSLDVGDRVLTMRNWRTVTALAGMAGAT
jgi:uncharacterized protein (DUF1697 family)